MIRTTTAWEIEAVQVSNNVTQAITAGRHAGMSAEAATLAAIIGVLSVIRLERLPEDYLIKEAQKATPQSLKTLNKA